MAFLDLPEVQIYFLIRAKDGAARLLVFHEWALQRMYLPLHPDNSVPAALPLLEPAIAHYVAQWPRYMVPDVNEADAGGFVVAPGGMPSQIAPPENWAALSIVAWQHMRTCVDDCSMARRLCRRSQRSIPPGTGRLTTTRLTSSLKASASTCGSPEAEMPAVCN
jgi:hypothetical protein